MRNRVRQLVVDGRTYHWTRSRQHGRGPDAPHLVERVVVWTDPASRFVLRFVDDEIGVVAAFGHGAYDGRVTLQGETYNLNRPGVVAALIRTAVEEGLWDPTERRTTETNAAFALLSRSDAPPGTHL